MARPRKETAQDTRALALEATHGLLHQHGYLGVSMESVAQAIGVRKASLYHHFPEGKEQLVLEIADLANMQDAAGFKRALETHRTMRSQLLAVARYVIGERRQTSVILRDAMRFMADTHQQHIYRAFFEGQYLPLQSALKAGIARGELRRHDTERSTWAFLGLLSELSTAEDDSSRASLATFIVGLMLDGLNTTNQKS
jgi:AcrR family transcriptional regulator